MAILDDVVQKGLCLLDEVIRKESARLEQDWNSLELCLNLIFVFDRSDQNVGITGNEDIVFDVSIRMQQS